METQRLEKFLNGDLNLFHEFYESTKHQVFYNILAVVQNNENAEEILQDTYIKFLEKLSKLKIKDNPLGYLFKISRNLSLDFIRKNKHERHIEFEESNYEHSVQEETKHHNILEEAKKLLDEQEYEIVIMHAVNGHTHKEISQIIRKPIGTITWAYNNAIKKLRKGLAYYGWKN